jgi:hypothetical protein
LEETHLMAGRVFGPPPLLQAFIQRFASGRVRRGTGDPPCDGAGYELRADREGEDRASGARPEVRRATVGGVVLTGSAAVLGTEVEPCAAVFEIGLRVTLDDPEASVGEDLLDAPAGLSVAPDVSDADCAGDHAVSDVGRSGELMPDAALLAAGLVPPGA